MQPLPPPSSHRYAHLYPPISFFHLSTSPAQHAHDYTAHHSLVYCMLHGLQPPLHLFASTMHAAKIEAGQVQEYQQQQQQWQQSGEQHEERKENTAADVDDADAADTDEVMLEQPQIDEKIAPEPTVVPITTAASAASTAHIVAPAVAAPASASSLPIRTAVSQLEDDDSSSPAEFTLGLFGVEYTREQLLSLYRPGALMPLDLAASQSVPALRTCISSAALAPVCQSPPDARQSALQAELAKDASITSNPECAGEWWLPVWNGKGNKGGKGGGAGGKGGKGGKQQQHQNQHHQQQKGPSNKKNKHQQNNNKQHQNQHHAASSHSASSALLLQIQGDLAPSPVVGQQNRGKKRAANSTEPALNGQLASKRLYTESNISKMFIGPQTQPPKAIPAAPSSASTELPSKHDLFKQRAQQGGE